MTVEAFTLEPPYTPELPREVQLLIEDRLSRYPVTHTKRVMEFGSGASTIWWAEHQCQTVSVEHDAGWAKEVGRVLRKEIWEHRVDLRVVNPKEIPLAIDREGLFDLILVDCEDQFRFECVKHSIDHVAPGGSLIVDDSHWRSLWRVPKIMGDDWTSVLIKAPHSRKRDGQVAVHQTTIYDRKRDG